MTTSSDTPRLFGGWTRERFGPFLGLSGRQAAIVALAVVPLLATMAQSRWLLLAQLTPVSAVVLALTVIPVRRRPAYRWLVDAIWFGVGRATHWSFFRAAVATYGPVALDEPDLPGAIADLAFHDGPPFGPFQRRIAVVAEPHHGMWTATARVSHPGLGTTSAAEQNRLATALGELLGSAALTRQIARVVVYVRTVPSDGAARAAWVDDHRGGNVPPVIEEVGRILEASMTTASVRHELFVTVSVDEVRVRRQATEAGRGVTGRARVLYRNLETVERSLRDVGATDVEWLTTEQLAEAVRTGYNPGDLAAFEHARQASARRPDTATGVPLAAAGPTLAPVPSARRYVHDASTTVAYALLLPEQSTAVGALGRLLAPSEAGERRCFALHYEPLDADRARRKVETASWAMEIADEAKQSRGFRVDRRHRRRVAETATHEDQLAAGHTLVRVAAAAAVTVPSDWAVEDYAARFEADGRACGYVPLRADLAQDSAFVAAVLPLGVGLPKRGDR